MQVAPRHFSTNGSGHDLFAAQRGTPADEGKCGVVNGEARARVDGRSTKEPHLEWIGPGGIGDSPSGTPIGE